jgi:hypothetical protein
MVVLRMECGSEGRGEKKGVQFLRARFRSGRSTPESGLMWRGGTEWADQPLTYTPDPTKNTDHPSKCPSEPKRLPSAEWLISATERHDPKFVLNAKTSVLTFAPWKPGAVYELRVPFEGLFLAGARVG